MSKLSELLGALTTALRDTANDATDWVLHAGQKVMFADKTEARQKLLEAFDEAIADGQVTIYELAALRDLKDALGLSDEDYYRLKMDAFRSTMRRVMDDKVVTDDELKFLEKVQEGLDMSNEQLRRLSDDYQLVLEMHKQAK